MSMSMSTGTGSSSADRGDLERPIPRFAEIPDDLWPRERMLQRMFGDLDDFEPIGHYVLVGHLGHGGMGSVYEAYDTKLGRKVAIKRMFVRDECARVRFSREARALARLDPNVVQVHETGEQDGAPFIVMQFIDGMTLRDWLAHTPRSNEAILAVFTDAGRGLLVAHQAGLVHRDFKPDNVMVRSDGHAVIVDFGLVGTERDAALDDPHTESKARDVITQPGAMLGTPGYIAPEHVTKLSAKADQFSFCVALWEALYGERPFADTSADSIAGAVAGGALRVPKHQSVDPAIHAALVRGLQPEPRDRFDSMQALLAALAKSSGARARVRSLVAWLLTPSLWLLGVAQLCACP